MPYYLHTEAAAAEMLGLRTVSELTYYKNRALKNGEQASAVKGGIEYFDIAVLQKTIKQKKAERAEAMDEMNAIIQSNTARKTKLTQLCFEF
jgi:hypothetical protein